MGTARLVLLDSKAYWIFVMVVFCLGCWAYPETLKVVVGGLPRQMVIGVEPSGTCLVA